MQVIHTPTGLDGIDAKMFEVFSSKLGFSYSYHKEKVWGAPIGKTGLWSGVIGQVRFPCKSSVFKMTHQAPANRIFIFFTHDVRDSAYFVFRTLTIAARFYFCDERTDVRTLCRE